MRHNRRQPSSAELRELVAIGRLLAFRLQLIANERDNVEGMDTARLERQLALAWEDALDRFRQRSHQAERDERLGFGLVEAGKPPVSWPGVVPGPERES